MKKAKLFLIALIVSTLVITQFALVYAAPAHDEAASISGTIDSVTQITDPNTGVSIYEITLTDDFGEQHTVRVNEETAYNLGLLVPDDDGNLVLLTPDSEDWPSYVEILSSDILPEVEDVKHPVGYALAQYFSGIDGVDYDAIMTAHQDGYGFGVIAQALWLTQYLGGTSDDLQAVLDAKASGDYSYFTELFSEDETVPANWGQFRKAIMASDKKQSLGTVMSAKDKDTTTPGNDSVNHGNTNNNGNQNQEKNKDKSNNGNNGNKDNNGQNKKP